jgi:hypothetical protein
MSQHNDSLIRRAAASIRRAYNEIDRASRLLIDATPPPAAHGRRR